MSLYRRKGTQTYTMEFVFRGQRIQESTGTSSLTLARTIARNRRSALEEGSQGVKKPAGPKLFRVTAEAWLEMKSSTLAPNSVRIEQTNLNHLYPVFSNRLVVDLEPKDISAYQKKRLSEGASPKTVNLEVGTLRAVLLYCGQWLRIQSNMGGSKVKMLKVRNDVGISLTGEQETALLHACAESRSRSLVVFAIVAIYTGARFGVIRTLTWANVDFKRRCLKWGKDKTQAGDHREIPLAPKALASLQLWAENFPQREGLHYVFPTERYGGSGHLFGKGSHKAPRSVAYNTDPTTPMGSPKTAWEGAQKRARVRCRIHDLRHTAATRMLDAGTPMTMVARIMGWSDSQTVLMARRYSHWSLDQMRVAVESIQGVPAKVPAIKKAQNHQIV